MLKINLGLKRIYSIFILVLGFVSPLAFAGGGASTMREPDGHQNKKPGHHAMSNEKGTVRAKMGTPESGEKPSRASKKLNEAKSQDNEIQIRTDFVKDHLKKQNFDDHIIAEGSHSLNKLKKYHDVGQNYVNGKADRDDLNNAAREVHQAIKADQKKALEDFRKGAKQ